MTDHTEIPEDVIKTAKSIADGMDDCVKDFDWDEIQATIARAILAERERCARIAGACSRGSTARYRILNE